MDVAEIPSDVSSIEMLERRTDPHRSGDRRGAGPAAAHSEGPRGLGYFGG